MHLCSNRPEGFGPHSDLHPSLPTTCFIDTIVIPLASWIYLPLALLPLLLIRRGDPKSHEIPQKRSKLRTTALIIYFFLLLALIAMLSLEIARLVDAELGVGLLPFLYPAILVAGGWRAGVEFRWFRCGRMAVKGGDGKMVVRGVNGLFWVMLITVFSIKLAAYCFEGLGSRDGMVPQGRYRVVDEVTDVGVMVGLALVLAVMEVLT